VGGQGVFDTLLGPERTHAASLFWGAKVLFQPRIILKSYRKPEDREVFVGRRIEGLVWCFVWVVSRVVV